MGIIVSKFGGWANASAERVKNAADLFEKNKNRKIKVNSAIGKIEGLPKVTDLLQQGAIDHIKNKEFPKEIFEQIRKNHYVVFEPLDIPKSVINDTLEHLKINISQKDSLTPDYYTALLLGTGEELFSRLDAYYLREIRGFDAKFIDPREIGHILEGHPLDGKIRNDSYDNLKKLTEIEGIIVYPGFYGVDSKTRPMIYSRGGTDKTAADISHAVNAELYENWKDVDGIYSADPRIIKNPELMDEVTYKEIRELSYISFSVLHQEAMLPAMRAGIPINIKNLLKPDTQGTKIVESRTFLKERPVRGIAHIDNMTFVNIDKTLMNEEIGFADKVLTIFRENRISIDQITTGIDSFCLVIDDNEFKEKSIHHGVAESVRKAIDKDEFSHYLQTWLNADNVQIKENKSLICIVGEGMQHTVGILARVTNALNDDNINIEVIDQGSSERNIIIGIDGRDSIKAVKSIYNKFF